VDGFRDACGHLLARYAPDLVISDDMTTWPNRVVHGLVREMPSRPWHLAWQHGLHQPWYELRSRFDADFFLCYGRMHAFLLGPSLYGRVLPVGLPKLDRLAGLETSQEKFLSWFAQPLPEAAEQVRLLASISQLTGMPVRIRPHPAAPAAFDGHRPRMADDGLSVDDPASDPIETLRRCDGFLSTHSSAALEALMLQKTAVLFPSFGLTSFAGYPNVASDFTARAYHAAIQRVRGRAQATEAFLGDAVGGRRFDHTARAVRVTEALAKLRLAGLDPARVKWWEESPDLREALQGWHPVLDLG
jgi:hypothetical protein